MNAFPKGAGLALGVVAGATVCAMLTTVAHAADYPAKPIRLIVPATAGNAADIYARLVAIELNKFLGQQVVVDNRGGASGIIGFELIAKAAADGYTLGVANFPFITNPLLFAKLSYDTAKDFQPVVRQSSGATVMSVTPTLPVRSVPALIEHARAHPDKLSYGMVGAGGGANLAVALFKFMTGTQIVPVSYKGRQQAITDVIAGQVHLICDDPPSILPHIRAGRVRAIGVTAPKRLAILPDIPTIAEAGLPGYEMTPSIGYLLPALAPRPIVLRLNAEINKALLSPAMAEKFTADGSVMTGGTPEQFAEHLRSETAKWAGVIKTAGIKPQ
jgi:tripartite-type tricarboxylate transporter receptor subunit TctC